VKSNPCTGLLQAHRVRGGSGSQIQDKRHKKVVSQAYAPAAFIPRKYSWYSFQLEAEPIPRPQCDRKDYVSEKLQ